MKRIVSLILSCLMLMSFAFSAGAASVTNENELKTLLTDIASEFHATNDTTKDDVISYVKGKLPNAAVWATNGNYSFKKRLATEAKAGFVNMGIGVTLNNVTTELFIFRQDIAPISELQDTADELSGKIPTDISVTSEEWEVLRLINIERYKNGIRILTMPATMQNSAHIRAKEQIESFGHTRPDGTSWASAFEKGFKRATIGENATRDAKTPLKAVENWMNSEEHRKNLLTYDYNYTGIGNANKTYWVQMFAQSDKITSVTTNSGKTSYASVKEMESDYLICTDLNGVVSYAPIDTESMKQNGNQYTIKLNSSSEIVLTVGGTNGNTSVFADVSADSYYADAVKWAVDKSITTGTSATTFSPDNTCTRAQILTFLWRAVGSPKASLKNPFSDVKESDYFYDASVWAYQNGMVTGTVFAGDTPCTRSATVIYLWKNAGSPETKAKSSFTDVLASSEYAEAVSWAVNNKVTSGTSETTFSPDMTCTRGQIVTFLNRALK